MYSQVVVVIDLLIDPFDDFSFGEMVEIAQLQLELRVERLLVAILPGTRLLAHGDLDSHTFQELQMLLRLVFRALIRVKVPRQLLPESDGFQSSFFHKLAEQRKFSAHCN